MGWNDHFDPSEYDASSPDSMRALADRAVRNAPPRKPTPSEQARLDGLPTGDCWDCGRNGKLVGKGMCAPCYRADNF